MKKLLLSATILTVFAVNAQATNVKECPDQHSLLGAIGKLHGDLKGQSFEFTDKSGQKWRGSNLEEHASRVNLATGAEPTFTPNSSGCHVSYDKSIDTEAGKKTGVAKILTLDLVKE